MGIRMSRYQLESESIKSGFQHPKTMNNRSIVRMELGLATAFGLLLIAMAPPTVSFAQDNMSDTAGMANETAGNMTDGGNQSGNPLSEIPIIGDLLTGGK